jgi:transcriptional regulator with XRE-family HTH domain
MPRLLINKKISRKRDQTKKVTFSAPHSPFQKLVESARVQKRLSYAQLAGKLGDGKASVHPGTLWIWLHNQNGHPHPRSCKPEHLRRLARVLNVPLPRLQETLDASRHIFTKQESPMPAAAVNAWQEFVGWLENDKRTKITRTVVLNMARRFMASAKAVRD